MQIPINAVLITAFVILGCTIAVLIWQNIKLTKYIMHKESPDSYYAVSTPTTKTKSDFMKTDDTLRNKFFETIIKGEATDEDIKTFGQVENVIS